MVVLDVVTVTVELTVVGVEVLLVVEVGKLVVVWLLELLVELVVVVVVVLVELVVVVVDVVVPGDQVNVPTLVAVAPLPPQVALIVKVPLVQAGFPPGCEV